MNTNNEQLILNELKEIKKDISGLKQDVSGLKIGQEKLAKSLNEFREEVKESDKYTHDRINEGFRDISENMKQLFAHEKRITSLEHDMIKISMLLPVKVEVR
jgi:uncharacterized protein YoxC